MPLRRFYRPTLNPTAKSLVLRSMVGLTRDCTANVSVRWYQCENVQVCRATPTGPNDPANHQESPARVSHSCAAIPKLEAVVASRFETNSSRRFVRVQAALEIQQVPSHLRIAVRGIRWSGHAHRHAGNESKSSRSLLWNK